MNATATEVSGRTGTVVNGPTVAAAIGATIRAAGGRPEAAAPRRSLYEKPSAVSRMRALERAIGANLELYVKRDDALKPLFGNKLRYIEFIFGAYDALGADCLVHCGGLLSNYLAQLAVAGAQEHIPVHLIMAGERPAVLEGNPLIAETFGARVTYRSGSCSRMKAELAEQLAKAGHRPFVIDAPFTNHSAILGYLRGWDELRGQIARGEIPEPNYIVLCSSGNSYLGLRIGAALDKSNVRITAMTPIRFADAGLSHIAPSRQEFLRKKISEFAEFAGVSPNVSSIDADESFVGEGYGIPTAQSVSAVRLLAETEGLLLDPIYTGKAMAGLLQYTRSGQFAAGARVLFVHSGGFANFFASHDAFSKYQDRN